MDKTKIENFLKQSKGTVWGFAAFILLLALWALVGYIFNVNSQAAALGSFVIINLCLVGAGFYKANTSEGKGWLNGLIGGGMLLAVIAVFGLIFLQGRFDFIGFAKKCPLYLVVSMISGIIGINVK
ncbi:MAG: TIGR04086 family membrane protein [Eubacteriaceae bacterium]|nr:TIGR04086 family membrane protein [Eubacteriaceae bacterium]